MSDIRSLVISNFQLLTPSPSENQTTGVNEGDRNPYWILVRIDKRLDINFYHKTSINE